MDYRSMQMGPLLTIIFVVIAVAFFCLEWSARGLDNPVPRVLNTLEGKHVQH